MRINLASLSLGLALVTFGCGSDEIDITGDTPEQAAAEIATAVCERNVECGSPDVTCNSTQSGVDCTGTIEPVVYDQCVAELKPDIQMDLQACDLTPEQEATVNGCINAMLAQDCITQAELDAAVVEIEAGREPTLGQVPPECLQLEAIFETCGA